MDVTSKLALADAFVVSPLRRSVRCEQSRDIIDHVGRFTDDAHHIEKGAEDVGALVLGAARHVLLEEEQGFAPIRTPVGIAHK